MCSVYTIYLKSLILKLYSLKLNFRKRQFSLGSNGPIRLMIKLLWSLSKRITFYSLNKVPMGNCRWSQEKRLLLLRALGSPAVCAQGSLVISYQEWNPGLWVTMLLTRAILLLGRYGCHLPLVCPFEIGSLEKLKWEEDK